MDSSRSRPGSSKSSSTRRKRPHEYSSRDLKGLSVAHDVESFKEGEQVILTLKDKGVLDDDEDVLENVNLVDDEKAAENNFKRLKKDDYNPNEDAGVKDILAKYDDDPYASNRKSFRLGGWIGKERFSPSTSQAGFKREMEAKPIIEEEPDVGNSIVSYLKVDSKKRYIEKEPIKSTEVKPSRTTIEANTSQTSFKQEVEAKPILEEEPDVGKSVFSCLKVAAKKGYIEKEAKKLTGAKPSSTTIEAKAYTIEEKFYDDDRKGGSRRGQFQEVVDRPDYQPDIKLEYTDDSGRVLDQREAFRYLSHKFHGKGPGKNKIDKRLKKLEQESKMKQMSSIDTPLGFVAMMQAKQKELQTPYIILNKGK